MLQLEYPKGKVRFLGTLHKILSVSWLKLHEQACLFSLAIPLHIEFFREGFAVLENHPAPLITELW